MVIEERIVGSDSCNDGSCFTMFSNNIACRASILARNQFGVSVKSSNNIGKK